MIPRILCSFSLWLLLSTPALPAQTQDPAILLERARHEAYVRGNFDTAIRTLRALVDKYPDRRPIAAVALVELGQVYESLGRSEAREAYQRAI